MIEERIWIFLFIFILLALQMLLSIIQIRRYQRTINEMHGSGILGIGHRKGGLKSGEILILSYDAGNDEIVCCKSMKGMTIFACFKEIPEYKGMTLSEIRQIALELDASELKSYRKKHPYDSEVLSKKKGALIQAVEAIILRQKNDEN